MPLETGNTISELDNRWPTGNDTATRGDDHLRLIKSILKKQFPGAGGQGFSKPITLEEDFLNGLVKTVSDINDRIDNITKGNPVVFRMDDIDPGDLYGGTWKLLDSDATITFGDGTACDASATGENKPAVVLPKHTHTGTISGTAESAGSHVHHFTFYEAAANGGANPAGFRDVRRPYGANTDASGVHTHHVSGHVSLEYTGVENAKMDVRGKRIKINVWRRIS